eukprot:TRINITY_DN8469_c0_g1_i3.p2 TRINITY_DN8469_c0_g1~~TRINITY_DN8469_c0_g1_i3.p2  ORF type:complete len:149 (+),score=17.65 TRINITY_DN8469_c0_g1_i3:153-599(+)
MLQGMCIIMIIMLFFDQKRGQIHGFGKYIHSTGVVYEWYLVDGKQHGEGREQLMDKTLYKGTFINGKKRRLDFGWGRDFHMSSQEAIKDIGKTMQCMGKGNSYGLMNGNIRERIRRVQGMDMENFNGLMVGCIKEIGKMGNNMDKDCM